MVAVVMCFEVVDGGVKWDEVSRSKASEGFLEAWR
jgi:hypothetical protein